jgi:two-component system, LytTR family, response regulator
VTQHLRVVLADDERPARSYAAALLRQHDDVEVVAEASDGLEAVEAIERLKPDLAVLDLQMPELSGLEVVGAVDKDLLPLVIFITAHDEYAVQAFRVHAVDYLLKPVDGARLREALNRATERLERRDLLERAAADVRAAAAHYDSLAPVTRLERIPVRRRQDILLLPVAHVASVVAEGELLHLTTHRNERHTITYRLKDLEARLRRDQFVRLGRGALVAIDAIARVETLPGGLQRVVLHNGQQLSVSRLQSRQLKDTLLKL